MLPTSTLESILKKSFKFSTNTIKTYLGEAEKKRKDLETYLIDQEIVDEEKLYMAAAKKLDISYTGLKGKEIKKEIFD